MGRAVPRYDFGYDEGDAVPMFYDPLIGKVVVHGADRAGSPRGAALRPLAIEGLKTNLPALVGVIDDERFVSGDYDTGLLGQDDDEVVLSERPRRGGVGDDQPAGSAKCPEPGVMRGSPRPWRPRARRTTPFAPS